LSLLQQSERIETSLCALFYCKGAVYALYFIVKEGCSSYTIEARTVHEVVLADIQIHAGQALTDKKAMVTDIAERLNLQMSADKEQQKKERIRLSLL